MYIFHTHTMTVLGTRSTGAASAREAGRSCRHAVQTTSGPRTYVREASGKRLEKNYVHAKRHQRVASYK